MTVTTPAPWHLTKMDNRGWISVRSPDHRTIAEIVCQLPSETHGNAALISAAPDLLDALEDLVTEFDCLYPDSESERINRAKAAIRKAQGGAS